MTPKMWVLGSRLLFCGALVAPTLSAGPTAPLSPRGVTIAGGQWTWASGSDRVAEAETAGVYGTKGVAAPENVPGARDLSVSWRDANGNLWLFGGEGYSERGSGALNDLWKWDGTSWTWVSGSSVADQLGVYGTKGVPAAANVPGARWGSVSWTDANGRLWLFGGAGPTTFGYGYFNDLWRWDGTSWTWVSGSSQPNWRGTYGVKGVAAPANVPGAREGSVSWKDASGNLWLFGGRIPWATTQDYFNDLWRWDGTNWTWMSGSNVPNQSGVYGTKGVAAPENVPGARRNLVTWADASGNLWLFGGSRIVGEFREEFNDLWRWDGTNWTWVSGSDTANQYGVYGTKGVAAPANAPGARESAVSWTDPAGGFWLFGGDGYAAIDAAIDGGGLNDLWRWDGTTWTWISGSDGAGQLGVYGTKGTVAPGNVPGGRAGSVSWTDSNGSLLLFGGAGKDSASSGWLHDLWQWDGTGWTWVSGSQFRHTPGVYGTKGVPAAGNVPGARSRSVSGRGATGSLWLFGGYGYDAAGQGALNDLWKWDGTNWTWVSGSSGANEAGVYGTKGVPAPGNVPPARADSVSWTDASGSFWLFGGWGYPANTTLLNDLWKWDGTNWTWMSGSNGGSQYGTYGTKGVAAPENVPGARVGSVSWTDAGGNFWLFGGVGQAADRVGGYGRLNDLWRWDGTNWTWMSGSDWVEEAGSYGTKGVAAPENVPGARSGSVSWTDANGNLWLFGGGGQAAAGSGGEGSLNDLWKWDGTSWTWVSGSSEANQVGSYGAKGVAASGNVPGARNGAISGMDAHGNLWLFGGVTVMSGNVSIFNDLWKWDGTNWTWASGSSAVGQRGSYGTKGVAASGNVPGARRDSISWTDASGNLWLFGGEAAGYTGTLNDLWVFGTDCTSLAAPTAASGGPYGTGATIQFTASTVPGATWFWTGPSGFTSTAQNPTIPNATMAMAGTYEVRAIVDGCTSAAATTTVDVFLAHALTVSTGGAGTGHVASSPSGIDCGSSCSALFASGTPVTLTATPDGTSRFAGWIGEGCFGTVPCTLTMDGAKSVSATFLPAAGSGFFALTPCRVVDTRNAAGPWGAPALAAGGTRTFQIAGQCGVPADALAVTMNVTVTNATAAGSLNVYPGTGPGPATDTVTFAAARSRANNTTMGLVGGVLSVADRQATGTVDLILDVSGYFR
jgi:hypothetical protein